MNLELEIDPNWFYNNIQIRNNDDYSCRPLNQHELNDYYHDSIDEWWFLSDSDFIFIYEGNQYDKIHINTKTQTLSFQYDSVTCLTINIVIPNSDFPHPYLSYYNGDSYEYFGHYEVFVSHILDN